MIEVSVIGRQAIFRSHAKRSRYAHAILAEAPTPRHFASQARKSCCWPLVAPGHANFSGRYRRISPSDVCGDALSVALSFGDFFTRRNAAAFHCVAGFIGRSAPGSAEKRAADIQMRSILPCHAGRRGAQLRHGIAVCGVAHSCRRGHSLLFLPAHRGHYCRAAGLACR